jgi:hypothetical protein
LKRDTVMKNGEFEISFNESEILESFNFIPLDIVSTISSAYQFFGGMGGISLLSLLSLAVSGLLFYINRRVNARSSLASWMPVVAMIVVYYGGFSFMQHYIGMVKVLQGNVLMKEKYYEARCGLLKRELLHANDVNITVIDGIDCEQRFHPYVP